MRERLKTEKRIDPWEIPVFRGRHWGQAYKGNWEEATN